MNTIMVTATVLTTHDERLIDGLSTSFYQHLLHNAKKTSETDDNPSSTSSLLGPELVDQALQEIIRRRLSSSSSLMNNNDDAAVVFASDNEILQKAQDRAFYLWKNSNSSTDDESTTVPSTQPTSISLFLNQLHAGSGGLDTFMTWGKIQELNTSLPEKLTMLWQVEYIDDLLPDWDDVSRFLQAGLFLFLEEENSIDNTKSILQLHRKWFHQTRGSSNNPEYRTLQIDLAQNLVSAVKHWLLETDKPNKRIDADNNDDHVAAVVGTVLDMFGDWVDRTGAFDPSNECMQAIGTAIWDWLGGSNQRLPHIIRRHCPYAAWFAKWAVAYMTPEQTIALVSRKSPFNFQQGGNTTTLYQMFAPASQSLDEMSSSAATTTATTTNNNKRDVDDSHYATAVFALSILKSVLVSTRVSRFPWHLLLLQPQPTGPQQQQLVSTLESSATTETTNAIQSRLLNYYLQLMHGSLMATSTRITQVGDDVVPLRISDDDYQTIVLCVDAIDTIMCGTRNNDENDGSAASTAIQSFYKANAMEEVVAALLSQMAASNDGGTPQNRMLLRDMLDRASHWSTVSLFYRFRR
jgi:hypothetical protein